MSTYFYNLVYAPKHITFYLACTNKFLVQAKSYKYVLYHAGRQKSFLHYCFSHLSIHESFLIETCHWQKGAIA